MSGSLVNKTPVSLLQEWLTLLHMTPKYEFRPGNQTSGHATFCYEVTVGEINATGTGCSKKKAKQAAASTMLSLLIEGPFMKNHGQLPDLMSGTRDNHKPQANLAKQDVDNPVGKLQEMCTIHHWQCPQYKLVFEHGLPHERSFVMSVQVYNFQESGLGRSKRLAKREAALKLWSSLKNRVAGTVQKQEEASKHYIALLQEIAHQHKFHVQYLDLEDTTTGLSQCIVCISTWPLTICRGQGTSHQTATANATMNALDCLSLITKKYNKITFDTAV